MTFSCNVFDEFVYMSSVVSKLRPFSNDSNFWVIRKNRRVSGLGCREAKGEVI